MKEIIYRIPYMGSKQKIVKKIYEAINNDIGNRKDLFSKTNINTIYDLFTGGGSVGYYFYNQGWQVYMNDIHKPLIELHKVLNMKNSPLTNELLYKWISREEFNELKNRQDWHGELIRCCWSFGNSGKGYLYGKDIEEELNIIYNIIFNNDLISLNKINKKYNIDLILSEKKSFKDKEIDYSLQINNKLHEFTSDYRGIFYYIGTIIKFNCSFEESLNHSYFLNKINDKRYLKESNKILNKKEYAKKIYDNALYINNLWTLRRYFNLIINRLVNIGKLKNIKNINFSNKNYYDFDFKPNSIIYTDSPYIGTQGYNNKTFDFDKFDNWVREMKNKNTRVYISEYTNHNNEWREVASFDKHSLFNNSFSQKKLKQEKIFCNI